MKNELSPMMTQYLLTKEQYKNCILFYRLGDFYEMFFDDAKLVSKTLGLTLTGRECGLPQRAPMCGVPYHAADVYIKKLVDHGFNVAICEQLTQPEKGKKLVERDVIRVVTAGTVTDDKMLDEKQNNFLACVYKTAVSWVDITSGDFNCLETTEDNIKNCLSMINPSEVIEKDNSLYPYIFETNNCEKAIFDHFNITSTSVFDISEKSNLINSCGALLQYLFQTQKKNLSNIIKINVIKESNIMFLDTNTRRNLELTESIKDGKVKNSLLWVLDQTKCSMGSRMLKSVVSQPLINKEEILLRQNKVLNLVENQNELKRLQELLSKLPDIERLCGKIAYGSINPRECLTLAESVNIMKEINPQYDFTNLETYISKSINPESPVNLKDGGYIKKGFYSELDELIEMASGGKLWLAKLEATEREETKIKNLKISYNRIFGYFFEVLSSQLELVPYRWQRKQTVANGERYVSEELKTIEEKILTSAEKSIVLEQKIYNEIKEQLALYIPKLQEVAKELAFIDVICSFASVAIKNNYTMPRITSDGIIDIKGGRHPVVEKILQDGAFISNDCLLDSDKNKTIVLTGPNMAGKSTYMRQVALITLMAQIGSFVPADSASINITDRIFTRIGASDDLSTGQSTFMVEINEVAVVLNNATKNSLLILDEIGRGTSTFDGLSIAQSVLEYINNKIGAKSLFATHFHELTKLEETLSGVKNYKMLIKEFDGDVIFLRKVVEGAAEKSFGIEVAKMCGLPSSIISRATEILSTLEKRK